jgi:hypothetical protein
VQLSHARDDQFPGLLVLLDGERGILKGEDREHLGELLALGEGLRLDGDRDDGFGEVHLFQEDGERLDSQGVAGLGGFQPYGDGDVPRLQALDLLGVVGVHPQETVDPLALLLADVVDDLAFLELPRIHAHVAEVSRLAVGLELEHEAERERVGLAGDLDGFILLDVVARGRGQIQGRGQIVHDRVQQRLHPDIAERSPAEHGGECAREGPLPDHGFHEIDGDLGTGEEVLGDFVRDVRELVDEVLPPFPRLGHARGLDGRGADGEPLVLLAETHLAHLHEVHEAFEVRFRSHGELQRQRVRAELRPHLLEHPVEVRTDPIQLVDVGNARHVVAVRLVPDRL